MMLHRHFGRVLDLCRRATQHGSKSGGGHGRSRSDLALTSDLGAKDRCIQFDNTANGCGRKKKFPFDRKKIEARR